MDVLFNRSLGSISGKVSEDQGVPAFTMFVTEGWPQLQQLTQQHQAKDHFPESADFHAFCETYGPPATD